MTQISGKIEEWQEKELAGLRDQPEGGKCLCNICRKEKGGDDGVYCKPIKEELKKARGTHEPEYECPANRIVLFCKKHYADFHFLQNLSIGLIFKIFVFPGQTGSIPSYKVFPLITGEKKELCLIW